MIIRQAQITALSEGAVTNYIQRVTSHLQRCFPENFERLAGTLPDLIRHSIHRAAAYGFTSERDVCKFVDLILVFGISFDTDVNLPWAHFWLNDRAVTDPTARMDCLYEAAKAVNNQGRMSDA